MNPLIAIEYNNFAVSLMKKDKMESAITVLTTALEASKKTFLECNDGDADSLELSTKSLDDYMRHSSALPSMGSHTSGYKRSKGFIYSTAIWIPVVCTHDYESSVSISSAILFNLGLAHQLLAMERHPAICTNRAENLQNASQMYQLAYQMQVEDSSESNLLFQMATLNNLGFVFRGMNDSISSHQCFQLVLSNLLCAVDCGEGDASEYDNFFENMSHLIFHRECPVAVAA